jgi:ubiquinone/menaquinone biosynthesis C-methylase UbiE
MEELKKQMKEFYSNSEIYRDQLNRHDLTVYGKYFSKIKKFVPKGSMILDLGCGTGQVANHLSGLGYSVVGIDISPLFIKEAEKRKNSAKFKVMDVTVLDFKSETFDTVITAESIEHVLDPKKMLKEASRVLKKGGFFILRFPNEQNKLRQVKTLLTKKTIFEIVMPNLKEEVFGDDEDLCHVASTADITTFLKKEGFKIVHSKPFFWRSGLVVARKI